VRRATRTMRHVESRPRSEKTFDIFEKRTDAGSWSF
jgi:hypothetical protein